MAQHQYVSLAHNPAVAAVATEGHVDNPYNPFSRWGAPAVTWVEEQHEGFRAEYMDGKTLGDVCGGIGDPGQQLSCVSNARNVQAGSAALGAIVSTAQGLNSLATTGLDVELSRLPGDVGQQARRALVSDYRSARDGVDFLFNGNAHTGSRTGLGYLWDQQISRGTSAWKGDLGAQSRLAQTGVEVGGEIVLAFATGGTSAGVRTAGVTARLGELASRAGRGLSRVQSAIARGADRLGARVFPNARHLDFGRGPVVAAGPAVPRVPVRPLEEGRFLAKGLDDGGVNPSVVPEAGGVGTRGPPAPKGAQFIDPAKVRFTQSSVTQTLRTGENINDMIKTLQGPGGAKIAADFEPIRIFERNGQLFTLDNRRLLIFSQAGRQIPFRMATPAEIARDAFKFTATPEQLGGQFIRVK